jgi:hypothetical protein
MPCSRQSAAVGIPPLRLVQNRKELGFTITRLFHQKLLKQNAEKSPFINPLDDRGGFPGHSRTYDNNRPNMGMGGVTPAPKLNSPPNFQLMGSSFRATFAAVARPETPSLR